jgi:iron complex outermembrane receptor protein
MALLMKLTKTWLGGVAFGASVLATPSVAARSAPPLVLHLPAQPLGAALRALALQAGTTILADTPDLAAREAPALEGSFTLDQALAVLLDGTGLIARRTAGGFVIAATSTTGEPGTDRDVVVTGSRIRGAVPVGANLITLDRTAIDRSGYATTQQLLQSLPQNFGGGPNDGATGISVRNNATANVGAGSSINLRGLGAASTLVLIDGNRPALGGLFGAFSDLSLIPSSAIERVEVLADGASALYGSDAVAGVVNLRLRNSFVGAETRARYGVANGFDEVQASQLFGTKWSSGHAVLGYEYYRRGRLAAADRRYATEDLTAFGGPDYRRDFSNPGTIIAADGQSFAIPRGQNGAGLTATDLSVGRNLADGRNGTDILPEVSRHAAYAYVDQHLGPAVKLVGQLFFADRRSTQRFIPDNDGGVIVPTSNPFYVDPIGTGQPIMVDYSFARDFGSQTTLTHVQAFGATAGADVGFGSWNASVRGSYGVQIERLRSVNIPNYYALGLALADPDPATAYNLFGDGAFTNRATITKVRGYLDARGRYSLASATFKIDGPLVDLPGGTVKVALGSEYRREHYAYDTTVFEFSATPQPSPTAGLPATRTIVAGFGELLVPLVGTAQHLPGISRLDLSIAGRVEHYSATGTTANPKVGASWVPVDGITVRGSFGTSFRAPSFGDLRQGRGAVQYIPYPLPDPASPSGSTNAVLLFGNAPGIGPERATTWTIGTDLAPKILPGSHLSLTYFDIAYRDRIASLSADFLNFLSNRTRYAPLINASPTTAQIAALYQDPVFVNPYGIPQGAITTIIDARTANLSSVRQTGLDFDIGYGFHAGAAALDAGLGGSYLFGIDQRVTATAAPVDVVSTLGNSVDLRMRGRLSASYHAWTLAGFVNFVNGYRNTGVTPSEHVPSWTTTDLQISYAVPPGNGPLHGLRVSLSVNNLFDRDPPYVNNPTVFSAIGYDADNANPIGRLVALQLIKAW